MDNIQTIDKEKELAAKIISGDKDAFGQLYDIYAPRVFRFVRIKVGSQALAEDLTSESFLRIWEYLVKDKNKVEETFGGLLYKIARNLITDYYKRKSSQEILMDDDFRDFLSKEPAKDEIRLKEWAEEIHKALIFIKEEYQDVIIWYYVEELSVPEIAKIMDKSEGNIRVLIHRALESLKKHIKIGEI